MSETKTEEKPKRTRRDRTDEIITAGLAEFSEHGFERANLERIAKSAGIAKGTIYIYFPSKEALFEAAVRDRIVQSFEQTEMDLSALDASAIDMMELLVRKTYERFVRTDASALMHVMISEGQRFPGLIEYYHKVAIERGTKLLRRILATGVEKGEIAPSALTEQPEVLISPAIFLTLSQRVFSGFHEIDTDVFIDAHIHMMRRALEPPG